MDYKATKIRSIAACLRFLLRSHLHRPLLWHEIFGSPKKFEVAYVSRFRIPLSSHERIGENVPRVIVLAVMDGRDVLYGERRKTSAFLGDLTVRFEKRVRSCWLQFCSACDAHVFSKLLKPQLNHLVHGMCGLM